MVLISLIFTIKVALSRQLSRSPCRPDFSTWLFAVNLGIIIWAQLQPENLTDPRPQAELSEAKLKKGRNQAETVVKTTGKFLEGCLFHRDSCRAPAEQKYFSVIPIGAAFFLFAPDFPAEAAIAANAARL